METNHARNTRVLDHQRGFVSGAARARARARRAAAGAGAPAPRAALRGTQLFHRQLGQLVLYADGGDDIR
jgi:hypothetical protein